jgi:Uncharacterized conserved protein
MVPVLGGEFSMGSPDSERRRRDDEGPAHQVIVSDYWISSFEISWDLYELFLLRNIDSLSVNNEKYGMDIDAISGATMPYVNYNQPRISCYQYNSICSITVLQMANSNNR